MIRNYFIAQSVGGPTWFMNDGGDRFCQVVNESPIAIEVSWDPVPPPLSRAEYDALIRKAWSDGLFQPYEDYFNAYAKGLAGMVQADLQNAPGDPIRWSQRQDPENWGLGPKDQVVSYQLPWRDNSLMARLRRNLLGD